MQPFRILVRGLDNLANSEHYLFTSADLHALLPELSSATFKTLLSRAVSNNLLVRISRGLYFYPRVDYPRGLLLFHAAARLRADTFNYISLETVLSDEGVISQVPINRITLMSAGRTHVIHCGDFGTIEFVHTNRLPSVIENQLIYDAACHLWRASVPLALRDMRATRRSLDLVDWGVANEFI